jgi:hypothetical protein
MRTPLRDRRWVLLLFLLPLCGHAQGPAPVRELVPSHVTQECPSLLGLYQHLHSHPELSFQETQTAARV